MQSSFFLLGKCIKHQQYVHKTNTNMADEEKNARYSKHVPAKKKPSANLIVHYSTGLTIISFEVTE